MTLPLDLRLPSVLLLGIHVVLLVAGIALVVIVWLRNSPRKNALRPLPSPETMWTVPMIILLAWWEHGGKPIRFVTSPASILALASLATGVLGLVSVLLVRRELRSMERDRRIDVEHLAGLPKVCAIARFSVWQGVACTLVSWLCLEMPLVLVVLLGAFCLMALVPACSGMSMAWYRLVWGSTPFDRLPDSFDLFLSYKSQNVSIARLVADQLLASGVMVWFAEYFILVEKREEWKRKVDEGIHGSDYGLVLTNDLWSQSEHTRHEIEEMRKAYGADAANKILEVKLPEESWREPYTRERHEAFEVLRHDPQPRSVAVQPSAKDANKILAFIGDHTGWKVRHMSRATGCDLHQEFEGIHMEQPYHLDISGWDLVQPGGSRCTDGDIVGPVLRTRFGRRRIGATLILGVDPPGERLAGEAQDQQIADRALYDKLIASHVRPYLEHLAAEPRGVHLMFHGGFTQLAVTYWAVLTKAWVRMYSVILPCPGSKDGRAGEFVFSFFFHGPFDEYCQTVPVMDRLVTSLRWDYHGKWSPADAAKIVEAVEARDLTTARKMLAENRSLLNVCGKQGGSLLHDAAFGNWIPAVQLLVSLGADANARTQQGNLTPLHCLAPKGAAETAQVLLDHAADIDARNDDGWTPLHFASWEGNCVLSQALMDRGASIDACQVNGWTPLHLAAMRGRTDMVRLLLARGADVNARSLAGGTPLHVAAGSGKKDVAGILLNAGADINARTRLGETPVTLAIKHGKLLEAEWLQSCGGD